MTLIERAARAACTAAGYDWWPDEKRASSADDAYPIASEWTAAARAVLEAIREPSDGMINAAQLQHRPDGTYRSGWKAMIDAALVGADRQS